jgi:hypothetical protein
MPHGLIRAFESHLLVHQGLHTEDLGGPHSEDHAKLVVRKMIGRASLFLPAGIRWWLPFYICSENEVNAVEAKISEFVRKTVTSEIPHGRDTPNYVFHVEYVSSRCFLVTIFRKTIVES